MIYHYTSIDTLELILKNQKTRFGRLDYVDDRNESEPFNKKPIADKIFVSCWTESETENVTLWKMYGDDFKGVRIGLEKPFFKTKPIGPGKWKGVNIINTIRKKTLFLPHEFLTKEYFIIPSFVSANIFCKKIEYIPYNELEGKYDKLTKVETQDNVNYTVSLNFHEIAKYKSKEWETQQETRFVLGVVPLSRDFTNNLNFDDKGFQKLFVSDMLDTILNERKLSLTHFDVELDPVSLKNIQIIGGPKCDLKRIERLIETYDLKHATLMSMLNLK